VVVGLPEEGKRKAPNRSRAEGSLEGSEETQFLAMRILSGNGGEQETRLKKERGHDGFIGLSAK